MNAFEAFDYQVKNFLDKNYPQEAGLTEAQFIELVTPLKNKLTDTEFIVDLEKGKLSFVLVINSEFISTKYAMSQVNKNGKQGVTKLFPHEPKDFTVIESEHIPAVNAYLLMNIDRGKETLNVIPKDAMETIISKKRIPLTIDEGVAIVTHYPEFLMKNNCFSLLASRNSKDQRVPAIWINSAKQPNLGWCWNGNPHTWLGSASAEARIA